MTGGEITLRDVYEAQIRTQAEMAALRTDLAVHAARTTERLDHGQRKLEDLEQRMRAAEAAHAAMPASLAPRVDALEDAAQRRRGMSSVLTVALSLAGSGSASAAISYLLARH